MVQPKINKSASGKAPRLEKDKLRAQAQGPGLTVHLAAAAGLFAGGVEVMQEVWEVGGQTQQKQAEMNYSIQGPN